MEVWHKSRRALWLWYIELLSCFGQWHGLGLKEPAAPGVERYLERLPDRHWIAFSDGFQNRQVRLRILPEIESFSRGHLDRAESEQRQNQPSQGPAQSLVFRR
jgi:hypothetical protein